MTPSALDGTHAPELASWVTSANKAGADFPIQNLPFGRFKRKGQDEAWRIGVAIGDQVLDLRLARAQCPWPADVDALLAPLADGDLNTFMAFGTRARTALRQALSAALAEHSDQGPFLELCLVAQADVTMSLPCQITDYTDFYTGIHHATAVGKLFRPDNPLLPNYKWVPIGYHGRVSSIVPSGTVLKRPVGQTRAPDAEAPTVGLSRRLDYELELGILVGTGNSMGEPKSMQQAEADWFGLVLLNDWSARDLQAWEYQPLGPFLSKNFGTTLSPWVITQEALAPFRCAFSHPAGDPAPLPYLDSDTNREQGAIDITLEVWLLTARMRTAKEAPHRLMQSNFRDSYWTVAQLLAHHTVGGCNLQTGDLLGSGTQSGSGADQGGSLLELSQGGKQPITLPNGETRAFLENGDTVILRGFCEAPGRARIGLGTAVGTIAG